MGMHGLINGAVVMSSCVVVGVLSSWLLPIGYESLQGLTVFIMDEMDEADTESLQDSSQHPN